MNEPTDTAPTSRRTIMRAGVGLLGTGLAAVTGLAALPARAQAPAAAPAPGQKLPQSAVQYQNHPKNGQLCSICVNFVAPNACAIVEGPINPIGWCVAFAPKA